MEMVNIEALSSHVFSLTITIQITKSTHVLYRRRIIHYSFMLEKNKQTIKTSLALFFFFPWVYLPVGTEESLMKLHQAKRPVIVYWSVLISIKLICNQQLIPIKPNKENGNNVVYVSISDASPHSIRYLTGTLKQK